MGIKRRPRPLIAACLVLASLLVFGCNLSQCSEDTRIAEKRRKELLASQGMTEAPVEAPSTPPEKPSVVGAWEGELRFDKFTVHAKDGREAEAFEDMAASTLNQDYPITIVIKEDAEGQKSATLDFGGSLKLKGTYEEDEDDEFILNFKKKGDKEFKVGASPPVEFTLKGYLEHSASAPDTLRGRVVYEVFQADGQPAWDTVGKWATPRK